MDQAAEILDVSKSTIRRLVAEGQLQAFKKLGVKALFVKRKDLEPLKIMRPIEIKKEKRKKGS